MPKFIVSQTFETLGDPCKSVHTTREAAETAADQLRDDLAKMIAAYETPDEWPGRTTGYSNEVDAWENAREIAGVEFGDDGRRTAGSPAVYGEEAAKFIAEQAVAIDEEEDDADSEIERPLIKLFAVGAPAQHSGGSASLHEFIGAHSPSRVVCPLPEAQTIGTAAAARKKAIELFGDKFVFVDPAFGNPL
jgi:hypothetical protein